MKQSRITASLVFLCILVASGCVTAPRTAYRQAIKTEDGKQAGFSAAEKQWITNNCPLGMPKKQAGVDFGNTKVIARQGYVLEHSAMDKIPLWVAEAVTAAQVDGPLTRPKPEPFAPDPKLEHGRRAELRDYRKSGYDRGHLAPSADQTVDREIQAATYFLSNMCPQRAALNQRIWAELEKAVRKVARSNGVVYVITGPMFYEEAEDDPATADGYIEYPIIGQGVAVPTHCYKIALWKDGTGQWQGTGVVMKNQQTAFPKPYRFNGYVHPIDWIEQRTGLNFSPDLPGPEVIRVERTAHPIWN